ncbi:MAG: peptidase M1, partial [Actinomycetota bacterium]|nr:peptidase M1 [Actinomycetota bacterium]
PDASDLNSQGNIGDSMSDFPDTDEYFAVVYGKGRAALAAAREAAGPAAFDAALRCYINAQAWQIAVPEDIAIVLDELPEAGQILDDAGAFG